MVIAWVSLCACANGLSMSFTRLFEVTHASVIFSKASSAARFSASAVSFSYFNAPVSSFPATPFTFFSSSSAFSLFPFSFFYFLT